jgi:hypothetical protein
MPAGSGERDDQELQRALVIFSLAAILALATAIECHSITHLSGNILRRFHDKAHSSHSIQG